MKSHLLFRAACTVGLTLVSAGESYARTHRYSSSSSSSSSAIWIVCIGVVLLLAGIVAVMYYLDRRRAEQIQAVAARLAFTYRRKPTDADKALIVGCHIANAGHSHLTSNILEAAQSAELRMTLFDHVYTIGYGKSSQQYNQTVTRMQSPVLNLPAFVLFRKRFFRRSGSSSAEPILIFPKRPSSVRNISCGAPTNPPYARSLLRSSCNFSSDNSRR